MHIKFRSEIKTNSTISLHWHIGYDGIVRLLIENDADVNAVDSDSMSVFLRAISNYDIHENMNDIPELLLQKGVNVSAVEPEWDNAVLNWAATTGKTTSHIL